MTPRLVLSCEHAGNRVPSRYAHLFAEDAARTALGTHRGWDIGALGAAKWLAENLRAPLIYTTTTRLLIDANRSLGHPALFSEYARELDHEAREHVIELYHRAHWRRVEAAVTDEAGPFCVLHLGIHSFTPELDGDVRDADVAFLYDPSRPLERTLSTAWQREMRARSALRVRRNYPYRGTDDGLTKVFRERFDAGRYLGIEVEINQAIAGGGNPREKKLLLTQLSESLKTAIDRTF